MHAWHALKTAINGYPEARRYEAAFRQEVFVAAIGIPLALLLPVAKVGKILVISEAISGSIDAQNTPHLARSTDSIGRPFS